MSKMAEQNEEEAYKPEETFNGKISILDLFPANEMTETSSGNYKMICPDCGLQGGRTEGFIIFPNSNSAYCHSSHKWFKMLEAYALKKKIINCLDGRDPGDKKSKILGGELYVSVLEEFKNEYGTDKYNQLSADLGIRKSIELPGNDRLVSDFCDELGDVYKSRNILFVRGDSGEIVEIEKHKVINNKGEEVMERGFRKMEGDRFVSLAEVFVRPWTTLYTKTGQQMIVNKSMSQSQANVALASPNFQRKLPIIMRMFDIQIPILYKKKLTFPKRGYDSRFGSWLPQNAPQIRKDIYTLEDAKVLIEKIFEEFCFKSDKDRNHAIAAFLTPYTRGLLPEFSTRTPIFIYMSNRERAGKDYCAGCAGMLYEGMCIDEPPISNDEKGNSNSNEEIRKKIMACMMQGKKRFHSANCKGLLNNSVFEAVTTSKVWSDRVLGKSKIATYNNEMDYSLSGNVGIRLTPDLANRAKIINLHLVDEDANGRKFKNPRLHEWILENRELIVSALYKLVENWAEKGMPDGSIPFTSFPEWAKTVGGIMESAGYPNPCLKDDEDFNVIFLDVETQEMKQLYETCYEKCAGKWLSKQELQKIAEEESIITTMDFNNKSDQIKFGFRIDKYVERQLSGIIMKVDKAEKRAARRRYVFVKNTESSEIYKDGNVVMFGNVSTTADVHYSENTSNKETLPFITTLPLQSNKTYKESNETYKGSNETYKEPNETYKEPIKLKKIESLKDFVEKGQEFLRKKAEENTTKTYKEKSNRELQFWEAPECAGIVEQCTKEQVLEWIKTNPAVSFEVMDAALGLGCLKHIGILIAEGVAKQSGNGWEVMK